MPRLRIHYLQHAPHEEAGYIHDIALKNDYSITSTRIYKNETLPGLNSFDVLVVMGGPMGADDEQNYHWLRAEKNFIREVIKSEMKVIGICLGSQLLASALGARVYQNSEKEIGFFPVTKRSNNKLFNIFPEKAIVFHWHGDTFDLPAGTELLASSEVCANQAFLYGKNVLALQFHLEITEKLLTGFIKTGKNELMPQPYVQSEEIIKEGFKFIPTCNLLLEELFKNFLNAD